MSGNLGPACRHDHDAKTVGGWTVRQHRPGCFTWTSPTGNQYRGRAARVIPELPVPPQDDQGGREPDEPPF